MANSYGRQVVVLLTNKSGGAIIAGDVVIVDTANDTAFTTTTTGRAEVSLGIAQESIASNASGRVLVSGYAALVNVPASVTRGHFVETHTVAKQATGNSTRRSGSFGQFLTGGTTPTAEIWGAPDFTASGSLTDHTHAVTGSGATGGGATINVPTLNATGLFRLSGILTSTVNADQNDFNPANLHTSGAIWFTSFSANRTITGIDAGVDGEVKILQNNSSFSMLLTNESLSSTAANRFRCPNAATHTVRQQGSVLLVYIGGRWCVIAA